VRQGSAAREQGLSVLAARQQRSRLNLKVHVYVHDVTGRLSKVNVGAGRTAYYVYDASGLVTRRMLPTDSVHAYYDYDAAGRLSVQVDRNQPKNAVLRSATFTRNANGAITKVDRTGNVFSYYVYDSVDRLTHEQDLNALGNTRDDRYVYDAAGNSVTKDDQTTVFGPIYYAYDARNLLWREHDLVGIDTTYYAYDKAQRMTKKYPDFEPFEAFYFAHDQRGQSTRIYDAGSAPSGAQYFAYNGVGERVVLRREAGATSTASYFSYDEDKLIREIRNDGVVLGRYRHNRSVLSWASLFETYANDLSEVGDGKALPTFDERGSVVQLGTAGGALAYYAYDRYGNMAQVGSNTRQRARFLSSIMANLDRFSQTMYMTTFGSCFVPAPAVLLRGTGVNVAAVVPFKIATVIATLIPAFKFFWVEYANAEGEVVGSDTPAYRVTHPEHGCAAGAPYVITPGNPIVSKIFFESADRETNGGLSRCFRKMLGNALGDEGRRILGTIDLLAPDEPAAPFRPKPSAQFVFRWTGARGWERQRVCFVAILYRLAIHWRLYL
jgi:YD repeat-containing protein